MPSKPKTKPVAPKGKMPFPPATKTPFPGKVPPKGKKPVK